VLLHLPQILHALAWDRNQTPAVRSRWLITWFMTQSDAGSLLRLMRGRWKNWELILVFCYKVCKLRCARCLLLAISF